MNFDVNKIPNSQQKRKKESAVQALQRKNEEYNGVRVERVEPKQGLKSSADRDLDDVTRELPNTLNDIVGFGARIEASKRRLGLGEGGFLDCEMEILNLKTGQYEGRAWRTSQQINAEFIVREPMMTDEQLDDFMKTYFVEFNTTTGEVYPKRYPNVKNIKFSVNFPEVSVPKLESVSDDIHDHHEENVSESKPKETVQNEEKPVMQEIIPTKKVVFTTEERKVGIRKQLNKKQVAKISEMILDRNSVSCVAVASRYKCDITGVTYEEYEQIHTMVETSTLAREIKMWSVIYRHIKNVSIGEFKDFNDFCEHTAYADRNRFWFALMCTMSRDTEKVALICRNRVWKPVSADYANYDLTNYTEEFNDINDISLLPTTTS